MDAWVRGNQIEVCTAGALDGQCRIRRVGRHGTLKLVADR